MCCSGKRTTMRSGGAFRPEASPSQPHTPAGSAFQVFQSIAARPLTVQGPVSGKQYRFFGPGATVAVDPRDHASLTRIPHIREIKR